MELHNLKPAKGAVKKVKRIGRGQGSGHGGTSTAGHKGAQSRTGYSAKRGFEGGQMPLQRRLPKRGFKNFNRVEVTGINLDNLSRIAEKLNTKTLSLEVLVENGFVHKNETVKVLGRGEVSKGLFITAHSFSESAKSKIEAAGGTASVVA